jgi:hypothetical protein
MGGVSLLQSVRVGFCAHTPVYTVVPWALASGLNGGGVKLTSYCLHVVPKGKNVWSYTSTAPHAFMARTVTTLPLPY